MTKALENAASASLKVQPGQALSIRPDIGCTGRMDSASPAATLNRAPYLVSAGQCRLQAPHLRKRDKTRKHFVNSARTTLYENGDIVKERRHVRTEVRLV